MFKKSVSNRYSVLAKPAKDITPAELQVGVDLLAAAIQRAKLQGTNFDVQVFIKRNVLERRVGIPFEQFLDQLNQELMSNHPRLTYPTGFVDDLVAGMPGEMAARYLRWLPKK